MGFSLLRPSLPLSLKPRQRLLLILTSTATEDTDWDTDTGLEDTTVDTVLATTASVRLRLPPRLRLTPTFCMVVDTTVLATGDTTTARGRLRLPPRLRLTPTFVWWIWSWIWSSWLRLRSWLQGILLGINYQHLCKT